MGKFDKLNGEFQVGTPMILKLVTPPEKDEKFGHWWYTFKRRNDKKQWIDCNRLQATERLHGAIQALNPEIGDVISIEKKAIQGDNGTYPKFVPLKYSPVVDSFVDAGGRAVAQTEPQRAPEPTPEPQTRPTGAENALKDDFSDTPHTPYGADLIEAALECVQSASTRSGVSLSSEDVVALAQSLIVHWRTNTPEDIAKIALSELVRARQLQRQGEGSEGDGDNADLDGVGDDLPF